MVRNIIFDLGNVLIPLKLKTLRLQLALHGFYKIPDDLFAALHVYEKGEMSSYAFIEKIREKAIWGNHKHVEKVWNSLIGDFSEEKLKMLRELKKDYRLFLLSNINELHEKKVERIMGVETFETFCSCFTKMYYSHHIGYRKPEKQAFQIILDENKLNPTETLFVDDLEINTNAANELGIKTWLVKNPKMVNGIKAVLKNENL